MKSNYQEWIKKAESDWRIVKILATADEPPNDGIAFHCQQMAEKYLKAYLVNKIAPFSKTHNLVNLMRGVAILEPSVNVLETDLEFLNQYSVAPRYPGDYVEPTDEDIEHAIASSKRIRYFFRKILNVKKKSRKKK